MIVAAKNSVVPVVVNGTKTFAVVSGATKGGVDDNAPNVNKMPMHASKAHLCATRAPARAMLAGKDSSATSAPSLDAKTVVKLIQKNAGANVVKIGRALPVGLANLLIRFASMGAKWTRTLANVMGVKATGLALVATSAHLPHHTVHMAPR
jgi:hypothetical protein